MKRILCARRLTKVYGQGAAAVTAVSQVDLEVYQGDFLAIVGQSGSGKTTLLNLLGCIFLPSFGDMVFEEKNILALKEKELAEIRRRKIGYVFQDFKLIPILTAEENITMPLLLDGKSADKAYLHQLAETLGIAGRLKHLPSELSGGERQRVAIARALISNPSLILADEPTGNLDQKTADEIMRLLVELNEQGRTIVLVTHNERHAKLCRKIIRISDGRLMTEAP